MDAERIPVGYVKRAHGIRGDLLVVPLTDDTGRFSVGASFGLDGHDGRVTVTAVRPHNEGVIVSLAELSDRTAAEGVVKRVLTIDPAERRDLADDEYWPDDLVGLSAVDGAGTPLGTVTAVVLGAAQDRLTVTTPGGAEVDVPFVAALVDRPRGGHIVMHVPVGLFPADSD
jgi:16S rRNA processing protein RimM